MTKSKSPSQLPPKVHAEILRLGKIGDRLAKQAKYDLALAQYRKAWALVPDDKANWEASTSLLAAAGDVFFRLGDFKRMVNRFARAVRCPGGLGDPFIHLRLGQGNFELGDMKKAIQELARAYLGAGDEIFKNENPKYLAFVRTKLRPPEPGKKTTVPAAIERTAEKSPAEKSPVKKMPAGKLPATKLPATKLPVPKKPADKRAAAKKPTGKTVKGRR